MPDLLTTLAARKKAARDAAITRREAAHLMLASQSPAALLAGILAGFRGVPLAGYLPIRSEINPLPVMEEAAAHGPVAVPIITAKGQPLDFARWSVDMEMIDGPLGTRRPRVIEPLRPEILIVPLLAFDRAGNRLGYGGGFYDRTLAALRADGATLAIGFAYDEQVDPFLPLEPTDQPLDMIVTQSQVLTF